MYDRRVPVKRSGNIRQFPGTSKKMKRNLLDDPSLNSDDNGLITKTDTQPIVIDTEEVPSEHPLDNTESRFNITFRFCLFLQKWDVEESAFLIFDTWFIWIILAQMNSLKTHLQKVQKSFQLLRLAWHFHHVRHGPWTPIACLLIG